MKVKHAGPAEFGLVGRRARLLHLSVRRLKSGRTREREMAVAERVLVVTGGSRGIGAATARLAAERGYAVVVNYAGNVEAAETVCADIIRNGGEAVAVRGDVSDETDVEHIFAAADRLGTLVGLVNNAGIIG